VILDAENLVALIIAIAVGLYTLYCLFRPEDL
jgi:Na+/H+ antiporter NhaB